MSARGPGRLHTNDARLTRAFRDRIDMIARLSRAEQRNGKSDGKPLPTDQLRAIGLTPKGTRSSTGRKPWTQPPHWYSRSA